MRSSIQKKGLTLWLILLALSCFTVSCLPEFELDGPPMLVDFQTTTSSEEVRLPLKPGLEYRFLVDWGDGSDPQRVRSHTDANTSHIYETPGTYTVSIKGVCEGFGLDEPSHPYKNQIVQVQDFGKVRVKDLSYAFRDTPNLTRVGGGDLTSLENIDFIFKTSQDVDVSGLSEWNTRQLLSMEDAFAESAVGDAPIGEWDVSKVKNMRGAFRGITSSLVDVSEWNTSSVENMSDLFMNADNNPDVEFWDVSKVKNMNTMFSGNALAQPNTSRWNTSSLESMSYMFNNTALANPDTSNWDISNVVDMQAAFARANSANPDTSNWDTSNVKFMNGLFATNPVANPDTSNWDTSNVENMAIMFLTTNAANPDTSNWDTSNVTDMNEMFNDAAAASPDVSGWDTSKVTDMSMMFTDSNQENRLDFSNWNFESIESAEGWPAVQGSTSPIKMNTDDFTEFLINLNNQDIDPGVVSGFNIFDSTYRAEASAAKAALESRGWIIGGQLE